MTDNKGQLAAFLARMGASFPYPATPDLLESVLFENGLRRAAVSGRLRTWAVAGALILALLLAGLAVPEVRAALVSWLEVGVVRIFFEQELPDVQQATPLPSFSQLTGRTSLAEAQEMAGFEVSLPAGMRDPEHVYFQQLEGPVVLCIWTAGEDIELSQMVLGPGVRLWKIAPENIQVAYVDGVRVAWLEGYHLLYMRSDLGMSNIVFPVETRVLLWEEEGLTYRLAAEFSFEEAVELMRSLRR